MNKQVEDTADSFPLKTKQASLLYCRVFDCDYLSFRRVNLLCAFSCFVRFAMKPPEIATHRNFEKDFDSMLTHIHLYI